MTKAESQVHPIRGKVARILNTRELAINRGTEHGVAIGMSFDILDPIGEDIIDPDTKETIGSLERPKVRVKVVRVQERLSVASTYKTRRVNVGGHGGGLIPYGLTDFLLPPKYVTKHETLKTSEKTWEDLSESESYVKTGDPVVEVVDSSDVEIISEG